MTVTAGLIFLASRSRLKLFINSLLAFLAVLPTTNFKVLTLLRQKKKQPKRNFQILTQNNATPAIELLGSVKSVTEFNQCLTKTRYKPFSLRRTLLNKTPFFVNVFVKAYNVDYRKAFSFLK